MLTFPYCSDALDYTKLESGKLNLEYMPCCAISEVQQVLQLMQPTAVTKRIKLRLLVDRSVVDALGRIGSASLLTGETAQPATESATGAKAAATDATGPHQWETLPGEDFWRKVKQRPLHVLAAKYRIRSVLTVSAVLSVLSLSSGLH